MREGHFGFLEALSLMVIVLINKIFFTSPMTLIEKLGTSAWLGTLISCLASLSFFGLLYLLMKRFNGQDLFQIFETVTGKLVGRGLIFLISLYFLYYTAINAREFAAILKAYSLPYTPIYLIVLPLLVIAAAMTYVGLEGIARVAYVFVFPIFGGLVLILVLAFPVYDWDYLRPLFGYGLDTTIVVGLLRSSAYSEIIFLAIIINSIHGLKYFRRVGISALLICGLVFSLCCACILAAFQYPSSSEHLSGMFQLSRVIYYSRFFQRIEAIFLFIWVFASVITIAIGFYISLKAYCRAFLIKNHRPLLFSILLLTSAVCFLPRSFPEILQIHVRVIREFSFLLIYLVPILVLLVAVILRRGGTSNDKSL